MPTAILNLMKVDGLTRENVASHLQKYRLRLKAKARPQAQRIGAGVGAGRPSGAARAAKSQFKAPALRGEPPSARPRAAADAAAATAGETASLSC